MIIKLLKSIASSLEHQNYASISLMLKHMFNLLCFFKNGI